MAGGPNQIGVHASPALKRLYVAAKEAGLPSPRLLEAGFLWLLEHPELRFAAIERLRQIEDDKAVAGDAAAFIRAIESRAAGGDRAAGAAAMGAAAAAGARRERPQSRRRSASK